MADFEKRLSEAAEVVSTGGRTIDPKLYADYVKYVGKLDALPIEEIGITSKDTDIHDKLGRVLPFSKWPTKSTRALARKMWDQYNLNLQTDAPSPEALEMDPCEDPNFMSDLLNACVRTSIRMGVDKRVAFQQCTKQVEKMIQAIRSACHGRGLTPDQQKEFFDNALELLGEVAGKPVKMQDLTPEDKALFSDLVDSIGYQKPREF